jgi:hypothetical protein
MILSEKVKVKSSLYYKDLGYDTTDKYIFVNIKDVPLGSRSLVLAKCDYCQELKELSYKNYNDNIKRGGKYACSIKCGVLKSKESNLKNIGVESFFQSDIFKEKSKKTLIEKWGVEHISKSEIISKKISEKLIEKSDEISKRLIDYYSNLTKEEKDDINKKREKTNLEKWGVKNISQSPLTKEKVKKTNIERWGGYTFESDILMEKVRKTNIERWGFTIPSKSDIIKKKTIISNLEKWGFIHPSMSDEVKNKTKNTLLEKYNVMNIMFSEEFRSKFNITNEDGYIRYLGNRNYEFNCVNCLNNYDIDYDNFYQRKFRNVSTCTKCFPILGNTSIKEKELFLFIKSIYNDDIITSYRDGLEIDIYLPKIRLGFEFNGLYWHSDEKLDKNYHLNKTLYFKERDIKIIHIWEDDWDFKKDIIKSQISNWLGLEKLKIFARNCYIKEIKDSRISTQFLNDNHIQGTIRSVIKLGLYHESELVSIMTFDNNEGRNKMEPGGWNLSRFCSKKNTKVIGGASKLLKYFINNWSPKRVISFSDKDWSTGNLYYSLGFKLVNDLKPDYKYIIDNRRVNKQRLTKKKMVSKGKNPNLKESELIKEMNIQKIYNVGQLKFELNF